MQRLGQIALTINGECCPVAESQSQNFAVRQITFGLAGVGTGAPGFVDVEGDAAAVYDAAIVWLDKMKRELVTEESRPERDVRGAERSGAFRPDA